MEAEKTVTYPISVAPNTLQPINEFSEMPRCRYEVVDTITHAPANVVSVGNKLLHKWTCESSAPNLWCMTVHSCFVEDGSGSEYIILNNEGLKIFFFIFCIKKFLFFCIKILTFNKKKNKNFFLIYKFFIIALKLKI